MIFVSDYLKSSVISLLAFTTAAEVRSRPLVILSIMLANIFFFKKKK